MNKSEYKEKIAQLKAESFPPPLPVQNCASCVYLDNYGMCEKFGEYPPLDFIAQKNECSYYEEVVPF